MAQVNHWKEQKLKGDELFPVDVCRALKLMNMTCTQIVAAPNSPSKLGLKRGQGFRLRLGPFAPRAASSGACSTVRRTQQLCQQPRRTRLDARTKHVATFEAQIYQD